jgi:oligoribonuclease NrnB/cAMP/cGMP phosphodiesterase (DHH superfamily)
MSEVKDTVRVPDILVFHYPCNDGGLCAWIVQHYCEKKKIDTPALIPMDVNRAVNIDMYVNEWRDKVVMFADVCWSAEKMHQLESNCRQLIVLDHHITNMEIIQEFPFGRYNEHKAGCQLVWDYFFPQDPIPPLFLRHIASEDLGLYDCDTNNPHDSQAFMINANQHLWNAKLSDMLSYFTYLFHMKLYEYQQYLLAGQQLYRRSVHDCRQLINQRSYVATLHTPEGKKFDVLAIQIYAVGYLTNILGSLCAVESKRRGLKFAVMYMKRRRSRIYSLKFRSTKDQQDVSIIARSVGNGGGHKKASACLVHEAKFTSVLSVS